MRLKVGPTVGSVVSLIALATWHIYSRTLRPDLRAAWWSHLITTVLGATTVVMIIETVRSATKDDSPEALLIQQAQAAGFLPAASGTTPGQFLPMQPHPAAAIDDIARTGVRPDYHIRLAPEGFYLWRANDWHPCSLGELETINGTTVMVQDEGGRERVRSQVLSILQRGGNTIVTEQ